MANDLRIPFRPHPLQVLLYCSDSKDFPTGEYFQTIKLLACSAFAPGGLSLGAVPHIVPWIPQDLLR